jgi:hypothetical protein
MITKQYLKDRVQYMHNVTGKEYDLSSILIGMGTRGYSVMLNGSHVCTFGHVAAKELDAAISAFVKGYAEGTK